MADGSLRRRGSDFSSSVGAVTGRRMSRDYVFMGIHQSLSLSRLRISGFSLRIKVVSISRRSLLAARAASLPFFPFFVWTVVRHIHAPDKSSLTRLDSRDLELHGGRRLDTSLIPFSKNTSVLRSRGATVRMQS